MIRIAVVEDEKIYRQQMRRVMEIYQRERDAQFEITYYSDGAEITEDIQAGRYDIIFMDIQMKRMDGMTAAEKIRQLDGQVILIFITSMTNYAVQGYRVRAMDYLVKPVSSFAMMQCLDKTMELLMQKKSHYILFEQQEGIKRQNVDSLFYVESSGHMLHIISREEEYSVRMRLQDLEQELVPLGFFRSSKGYLINMRKVTGMKDDCCLIHGEKLLISRARRKEFMDTLLHYMGEDGQQ